MPVKNRHIVFVVLVIVMTTVRVQAQDSKITFQGNGVRIRTVLTSIEDQTNLKFSYSSRLFDDEELIDIIIQDKTLEEALGLVFVGKKLRFVLVEQQIILKRDRRSAVSATIPEAETIVLDRRFTVSGYVRDVSSGEVLIGATVATRDGLVGTISNKYGFFSLTLNEAYDSLVCSYVGYQEVVRGILGVSLHLEFSLKEKVQDIREVAVYSDEAIETIRTSRSSEQRVKVATVHKMPALFGEKDVIKSLAAIPGIKFFGDGSTIFYVRGGSRDQNLITVDEAPVYNPTHLMGFFSTVVPDAVKDIQVYKGDFPAKYGGRLSSLIEIYTKDGNMQEMHVDGSLGLLSSKLSVEGPIWKDHISYFVSGRRSYILRPLQAANENLKDLHFADLHLKLNYRMNEKNRFFFSLYNSVDNFETTGGLGDIAGINWQNSTGTFRWNHIFSDKLFSNSTIFASQYDYFLNTNLAEGNYWNSHIDNFTLKSDFTWYISPSNTMRFGAQVSQHFMNPGNYYQNYEKIYLPYPISTRSANENVLYVSDQLILSDQLSFRFGLRINSWSNLGEAVEYEYDDFELVTHSYGAGELYHNYVTGDPRFSLIYKNSNDALLKFSFSRTSQFEHLITNSISPFSTLEVWLPSGPQIKPQRANQVTFGYSKRWHDRGLSMELETYYKQMSNQIDYRDHAKLILNPFLEYELRFGEGRAYGIEAMLTKEYGKFRGWLSYTLSRSEYQIEGINNGNPYPSYGDRPHDFSLFLSYLLGPRLELSGNFIYMTGAPFTSPTAFYYYENIQVPIYFKRNNDRLPDYHRLDMALNWNLRKKEDVRFKHELIFSIYNLYGRKNPIGIHFNKIVNEQGNLVTPYNFFETPELVPSQFYIYQMVPSVSYRFGF